MPTAAQVSPTSITRSIKTLVRPLYQRYRNLSLLRQLTTRGFTTGHIALGEQNLHRIPHHWITVDITHADFEMDFAQKRALPFGDSSQSIIYSSHMVEHLDAGSLSHLLRECRRVLKTGGYIRIETPDADRIVAAYRFGDHNVFGPIAEQNRARLVVERGLSDEYGFEHVAFLGLIANHLSGDQHVPVIASRSEVETRLRELTIDEFSAWAVSLLSPAQRLSGGHVNVMRFERLRQFVEEAGFQGITRQKNGQTAIPRMDLARIERPMRAHYSMYIEALR